jgi:hypothetical protein
VGCWYSGGFNVDWNVAVWEQTVDIPPCCLIVTSIDAELQSFRNVRTGDELCGSIVNFHSCGQNECRDWKQSPVGTH